ncbi:MAG: WecB/TagA/CpsF family glycosyltransferase [bacterium]|nr:WecB/TagA/CpsF family glycosyltransferase [bacterium]
MEKPFKLPKLLWYLTISLLIWLPLSPFVVTVTGLPALSLYRELVVIMLVAISFRYRRQTKQYLLDDTERLLAALVILALLSTLLVTHDWFALLWSARYSLEPWLVFWALHPFYLTPKRREQLLGGWVKLAVGLILIGILMVTVIGKERLIKIGYNAEVAVGNGQWTAQATLPAYQTVAGSIPRLQSTLTGPIQFAGYLLILFALLPYVRQRQPQWYLAIYFITIVGLIGTFSRAAWVAVFLLVLWALIKKLRSRGWSGSDITALALVTLIVGVVSIGLVLFRANNETGRQLVAEIFNREGSDREHVESISQSLAQWPKLATTGFGFGRSGAGSIQNAARNSAAPAARFVDNSYLRWLEELGPLGLFVFCSLLVLILLDLNKNPLNKPLAVAGMALILTAFFTDMWLEAAPVITWTVFVGLTHQAPPEPLATQALKLFSYDISPLDLSQTLAKIEQWSLSDKPRQIITLNPEMMMAAASNTNLRKAITEADLITADGAGILAALAWVEWADRQPRWLISSGGWLVWLWIFTLLIFMPQRLKPTAYRVTGSDITTAILKTGTSQRLALLGSTAATLAEAKQNIARANNTNLRLVFCETGPEPNVSGEWPLTEGRKLFGRLNHAKPTILLVAYGVPKQELVIQRHRSQLGVPVMIGVSGAFDSVIAQTVRRAPKLIQDLHLEWLWRLILQPKRWGRIYTAVWQFPSTITRMVLTADPE